MLATPSIHARHATVRLLLAVACACLLIAGRASRVAASQPAPEYLIKAAYLYNFAMFVEWPTAAFERTDSPIVIGVLGPDPFGSALDQTVRNKTVNNRRIRIDRVQSVQDLGRCHILFVSPSETSRLNDVANRLDGASVLIVGDTAGLAKRGAIITFVVEDNKVRLEVNVEAAKRARLSISSKLLNLARIVRAS
jgi:hypothetical protein